MATILIVEDDERVRRAAYRVLMGEGYEVLTASNMDEALAISHGRHGPIDLLLADVVLPGVSGAHVAETLQMMRPNLRVIYTSGFLNAAQACKGKTGASLIFLEKPWTNTQLVEAVHHVLSGEAVSNRVSNT